MKKCLILITSEYPFFTAEPFLETEMPYLAKEFDKVITLAVAVDSGKQQINATPENVDNYNVAVDSKNMSRAKSFFTGLRNMCFSSELLKEDEQARKNLKNRFFFEYFCARAEREFKLCKKVLEKYDFSKYDSVTVYSYWFFVHALIGSKLRDMLAPKCKSIKFISRGHGYDVYEYVNSVGYLPLREYLLSRVDKLYPCSIDGENHIIAQFPKYADKIKHSYLGSFDCGVSQMNDDGFHIVSCSRMIDLKRVDHIANALYLLKDDKSIGKLKWTHIGDGETMKKVRAVCDSKLSFMQVDLIGMISNTLVKEFYKTNNTDLLINVSSTEGLPVSMMEAQSFGIPIIATDVGGVSEIVKNGFNGWLISEDFTDKELAAKIKEIILCDNEKILQMRVNARRFWQENFDAEKNYTEFSKQISCI